MAPVGMVSSMSWFGPLMFMVCAVALLVLSILLITLCTNCPKNSSSKYPTKTKGNLNGSAEINRERAHQPDGFRHSVWLNHNNMPPCTLERTKTRVNQSQPESTEH